VVIASRDGIRKPFYTEFTEYTVGTENRKGNRPGAAMRSVDRNRIAGSRDYGKSGPGGDFER
jgi:hypothetical protein